MAALADREFFACLRDLNDRFAAGARDWDNWLAGQDGDMAWAVIDPKSDHYP